MPFKKLIYRQQKLASAKTRILILFFAFGISLTIFVCFLIQNNSNRENYLELNSIANEFSRDFENSILNSTLRVQWMLEKFDIKSNTVFSQRQIIEEILQRTIFQRMTIFRKKKDEKNQIIWHRIFYSHSPVDKLPMPKSPYLSSERITQKIQAMLQRKQLTAFALNTHENQNYVHLLIQLPAQPNEFIIFTSPLDKLLSETMLNKNLQVYLQDPDINLSFLIHLNHAQPQIQILDSKKKKIDFKNTKKNPIVNRTDIMSSLNFTVFGTIDKSLSHLTSIALAIGVLLTILITLLLRFILEQNQLVADLVVKRTLDLEDALNRATEADFAKNRFLANISHELRTPLNLILGMLELIEEKSQDPKILGYIQTVRTSGNHLLSLISDLLDITQKNDEIATSTKKVPIRCPYFFEEIVLLMSADCRKKQLNFRFDLADDIPEYFRGDPAKLRQILINLLRNAIKYTTSGFVELKVALNPMSVAQLTENKITIRMIIQDSGVGIPIDKQQQVFERFLQLDSTKILSQGGVGLGLSIVKDLVTKLEGNIIVHSEPFVGSSFTVDLDFEVPDQKTWKQSFIDIMTDTVKLAVVSNDTQTCKTVKHAVENEKVSIVFISPEKFSQEILINNNFSHVILDQSFTNQEILSKVSYFKKNLLIIGNDKELESQPQFIQHKIADNFPLLPSTLWSFLGVNPSRNKNLSAHARSIANIEKTLIKNMDLNVLIVDDDEGNRNLMRAYFSDLNWTIQFAENGQDAYKIYQERKPDVIVADLRMPIVDGFKMTDLIRSHERAHNLKYTPIILVTADVLRETQEESIKHQVDFFLTKPVRKSKIIETILLVHES